MERKVPSDPKKLTKFNGLQKNTKSAPMKTTNFFENPSSKAFDKNGLKLLGLNLKFAFLSNNNALEKLAAHMKSYIKSLYVYWRNFARETCRLKTEQNLKKSLKSQLGNKPVIKSLVMKDCFYIKAEKGNKVVILVVVTLLWQGEWPNQFWPLYKMTKNNRGRVKNVPGIPEPFHFHTVFPCGKSSVLVSVEICKFTLLYPYQMLVNYPLSSSLEFSAQILSSLLMITKSLPESALWALKVFF